MLTIQDKNAILTRMAKMLLLRGQVHGARLLRPAGLPQLAAPPDAPRPRSKVVEVVEADGSHAFYDTEGRRCRVAEPPPPDPEETESD